VKNEAVDPKVLIVGMVDSLAVVGNQICGLVPEIK
jgi:hypothetical protein